MSFQNIPGTALKDKQHDVEKLMHMLEDDLQPRTLTDQRQVEILTQLKIHGRDPKGSDAIYCDEGLETLCTYAFKERAVSVSQEALRVIANALLIQPKFRTKLADMGYADSLVGIYQRPDNNDEFLGARILFLLTYGTNTNFTELLRSYKLAEVIKSHLQRHGEQLASGGQGPDQMGTMALSESLKFVFNLANTVPSESKRLSVLVPSVCKILSHTAIPTPPLEPSLSIVINALAILDFSPFDDQPAAAKDLQNDGELATKLVEILRAVADAYKPEQLDTNVIPLLTVIRKVHEALPAEGKLVLRRALLPADSERDLPLGQSTSLASKLLRLTSSPGLTSLSDSISALMFELSDKDASTFVKNIGYGYAAGYLMTHKIPIPENVKEVQKGEDANKVPINPITGQRLDKETVPEQIEMTEEEKEREAERLFVLFERLRATGVVDVKNPVQEAMEQGRFQELSDSDHDPD